MIQTADEWGRLHAQCLKQLSLKDVTIRVGYERGLCAQHTARAFVALS